MSNGGQMSKYKGQCLCGTIKYGVDKIEPQMGHCHCTMCRKFSGAAFATFGEAKVENFHWLEGEGFLQKFKAENGTIRQFCKKCGSSMIFIPANDDGKLVEFTLGTLDNEIEHQPDAHIYTQNKAGWSVICDGLPEFRKERTS